MYARTTRWINQTSKISIILLTGIGLLALASRQLYSDGFPPPPGGTYPPPPGGTYPPPPPPAPLGAPLPGLTTELLAAFFDGSNEFVDVETAATGLGPVFNGVSCAQCHA